MNNYCNGSASRYNPKYQIVRVWDGTRASPSKLLKRFGGFGRLVGQGKPLKCSGAAPVRRWFVRKSKVNPEKARKKLISHLDITPIRWQMSWSISASGDASGLLYPCGLQAKF